MRYIKKPVIIEAHKFPFGILVPAEFYNALVVVPKNDSPNETKHTNKFYVRTIEGDMLVSGGDYVIKGVKGEFYPCKPDIFAMTYEKVED
jgi:hypothetical protein